MKKISICLDAGHGGKDSGAIKGSRYEKDDVLRLAKRVGKVLKANGIEVKYTRTTDTYDSPLRKAQISDNYDADYFISIHRNSSVNKSARGSETLVCSKDEPKLEIAKSIQKYFVKHGFVDRGVKVRKNLTVLRKTKAPALLIEVGFISNDEDNKLFDEKFNKIADCIAKGFMDAVGIKFRSYASTLK
jgi:N-acetylmuramoyl-L-alanine amidase